jgi:hypothetical protein
MHLANQILTDEDVHEAAARLREAFRANPTTADAQHIADMDMIFAWIMRQTELPAAYKRNPSSVAMEATDR